MKKVTITTNEIIINHNCNRIQYSNRYNMVTLTGIDKLSNYNFNTDVTINSEDSISVINIKNIIIE